MRHRVKTSLTILVCTLAVVACAGETQSGWLTYESAAMRLRVNYPVAWEIVPYGPENFDIQAVSGNGWLEIYMLEEGASNFFDLPYLAPMEGEVAARGVAEAFGMTFGETETLPTQAGEAAALRAVDAAHDEYAYIVVLPLTGRTLIGIGWGYEQDTWEETTIPIYREIIQSIAESEE